MHIILGLSDQISKMHQTPSFELVFSPEEWCKKSIANATVQRKFYEE